MIGCRSKCPAVLCYGKYDITQNNVHRQAQRFGLGFRAAAAAIALQLPPDATSHFEAAAFKRGLTCDAMIHNLLLEVAADPSLLDNILDDGV